MSARAFTGIPRQFARAARFQHVNMPKRVPQMWKNTEFMFETMQQAGRKAEMMSNNMRMMVRRMQVAEMQKIQIGALYMFSYVSKEILEMLEHYEELLEDEEPDDDEKRTTLTGRQGVL